MLPERRKTSAVSLGTAKPAAKFCMVVRIKLFPIIRPVREEGVLYIISTAAV